MLGWGGGGGVVHVCVARVHVNCVARYMSTVCVGACVWCMHGDDVLEMYEQGLCVCGTDLAHAYL